MSDNGNLPAYPHVFPCSDNGHEWHEVEPGLTKRERFAMAAMQAILTSDDYQHTMLTGKIGKESMRDWVVRGSIEYADALLAALEGSRP